VFVIAIACAGSCGWVVKKLKKTVRDHGYFVKGKEKECLIEQLTFFLGNFPRKDWMNHLQRKY
jgi:hypothetical protein